jgi:chemotaxis protein MotC
MDGPRRGKQVDRTRRALRESTPERRSKNRGRACSRECADLSARLRMGMSVLLTVAVVFSARAAEPERTISQMMSDLQRLQAQMAFGDKAAYALQRDRLRTIGASISAAKPETWKDKNETDAAVAYVLSGGQPSVIARLLEKGDIPTNEHALMRGAEAYVSGKQREAESLLGDIDPTTASLKLAGQLAFVQSVLKTSTDPKKAIALLDLARLMSPGGLVEEAALRREILLLGDQRAGDRVVFLARQYVTRFGHSIYAENFIQGLATAAIRNGLTDDLASLDKFRPLLTTVTPEVRRGFLLAIARAQTLNGKSEVAGAAAREALRDIPTGGADEAQAKLFEAAAQIVTPDYDAGVEKLKNVDRSRLAKPDQALLAAITFAAMRLRDPPSDKMITEPAREQPEPAAPTRGSAITPMDSTSATLKLGAAALGRTASLASGERTSP